MTQGRRRKNKIIRKMRMRLGAEERSRGQEGFILFDSQQLRMTKYEALACLPLSLSIPQILPLSTPLSSPFSFPQHSFLFLYFLFPFTVSLLLSFFLSFFSHHSLFLPLSVSFSGKCPDSLVTKLISLY